MSFSSEIKNEILNNFSKEKKKCCKLAEKFGEELSQVPKKSDLINDFENFMNIAKLNECCIKSILKGSFLGSGCVVDPNIDYHFEITFKCKACAEYFLNILSLLEFTPKLLRRKKMNMYTVYLKESEQISLFLSFIGASLSMLKFEQIRVEKDVKNNINRNINCETANLTKTINSSVKQIMAINKIKKAGKYNNLDEKLKTTAKLREKYPNESLEFIASLTNGNDKITKSGLKHRLDKIIEISDNI